MPKALKDQLSLREAARILTIGPQYLLTLCQIGRIPCSREGKQWRIPADFVEKKSEERRKGIFRWSSS